MKKYEHLPPELRNGCMLVDIGAYMEGKITLEELHYKEFPLFGPGYKPTPLWQDVFNVHKHPFVFGFILGNTVGVVLAVTVDLLGLN